MRTVALLVLRILGVTAALSPADLGALEVDAVRLALTRHARTQPGRALCSELPLLASARECQHVFSAVAEAVSLERRHWPSFSSPLAVAPLLSKLQSEPSLGVDALFTFSNAIESLEDLAFWAEDAQVQRSSPELSARAEAASPPDRLASRFIGAFESNVDGTHVKLSSEAFPILKQRRGAQGSRKPARVRRKGSRREWQTQRARLRRRGRTAHPERTDGCACAAGR